MSFEEMLEDIHTSPSKALCFILCCASSILCFRLANKEILIPTKEEIGEDGMVDIYEFLANEKVTNEDLSLIMNLASIELLRREIKMPTAIFEYMKKDAKNDKN